MPVYVYRAEDGTEFEVHQSIHDDAYETVRDSEGAVKKVKRVPQAARASFKGSGWARI